MDHKAAEHLEEFCDIKLSDNTICDLCQKEAVPMGRLECKAQSVLCSHSALSSRHFALSGLCPLWAVLCGSQWKAYGNLA
ncbi:MAG: hypothetical protein FWH27_10485 [Planctomycetaceae bacterium]|nr:hypothetical protein [Planctomycetaceae bacterium]